MVLIFEDAWSDDVVEVMTPVRRAIAGQVLVIGLSVWVRSGVVVTAVVVCHPGAAVSQCSCRSVALPGVWRFLVTATVGYV